ncbi:MAG: LytTR family DNA-binding domain-containing protein [Lachnospiraceae bacterium]|nr:LytTR family DNA-binding domain-containing protein [bacterium]MDY5518486.1 LytTR family DNA-binding domain-containing protein [Lachnospiraceae bacterium]
MMYRVGVCDDDAQISEWLERQIIARYEVEIHKYTVKELKEKMNEGKEEEFPDILFLDVVLERQNGIDLAKSIQSMYYQVQVIFMTGYIDYVSDVFEAQPVYLLLKPIQKEKLYAAIEKAISVLKEEKQQILDLTMKGKVLRIPYKNILYVESDGRYLYIHQNAQTERVTMKLSELIQLLPESFLRCHQSYLINMEWVKKFSGKTVELQNGAVLPVSRSKYQKVKETVLHYFADRMQERSLDI